MGSSAFPVTVPDSMATAADDDWSPRISFSNSFSCTVDISRAIVDDYYLVGSGGLTPHDSGSINRRMIVGGAANRHSDKDRPTADATSTDYNCDHQFEFSVMSSRINHLPDCSADPFPNASDQSSRSMLHDHRRSQPYDQSNMLPADELFCNGKLRLLDEQSTCSSCVTKNHNCSSNNTEIAAKFDGVPSDVDESMSDQEWVDIGYNGAGTQMGHRLSESSSPRDRAECSSDSESSTINSSSAIICHHRTPVFQSIPSTRPGATFGRRFGPSNGAMISSEYGESDAGIDGDQTSHEPGIPDDNHPASLMGAGEFDGRLCQSISDHYDASARVLSTSICCSACSTNYGSRSMSEVSVRRAGGDDLQAEPQSNDNGAEYCTSDSNVGDRKTANLDHSMVCYDDRISEYSSNSCSAICMANVDGAAIHSSLPTNAAGNPVGGGGAQYGISSLNPAVRTEIGGALSKMKGVINSSDHIPMFKAVIGKSGDAGDSVQWSPESNSKTTYSAGGMKNINGGEDIQESNGSGSNSSWSSSAQDRNITDELGLIIVGEAHTLIRSTAEDDDGGSGNPLICSRSTNSSRFPTDGSDSISDDMIWMGGRQGEARSSFKRSKSSELVARQAASGGRRRSTEKASSHHGGARQLLAADEKGPWQLTSRQMLLLAAARRSVELNNNGEEAADEIRRRHHQHRRRNSADGSDGAGASEAEEGHIGTEGDEKNGRKEEEAVREMIVRKLKWSSRRRKGGRQELEGDGDNNCQSSKPRHRKCISLMNLDDSYHNDVNSEPYVFSLQPPPQPRRRRSLLHFCRAASSFVHHLIINPTTTMAPAPVSTASSFSGGGPSPFWRLPAKFGGAKASDRKNKGGNGSGHYPSHLDYPSQSRRFFFPIFSSSPTTQCPSTSRTKATRRPTSFSQPPSPTFTHTSSSTCTGNNRSLSSSLDGRRQYAAMAMNLDPQPRVVPSSNGYESPRPKICFDRSMANNSITSNVRVTPVLNVPACINTTALRKPKSKPFKRFFGGAKHDTLSITTSSTTP